MSATLHRLPVDPDLELAMAELAHVAARMRKIEADLVRHGSDRDYRTYAHRVSTLNDTRQAIAGRAERLGLRPGSLLLFIEEHARLRERYGRKPSLAQLQRAVEDAVAIRRRDLSTRLAEQAVSDFRARVANDQVEDGAEAVQYMEASR